MELWSSPPFLLRLSLAAVIALGLSAHGKSKGSLSVSGSIAAAFVGFSSFCSCYRFGITLVLFYYSSSQLTKVNEKKKAQLEKGYKVGGQRNWIQVFANSILATILALCLLLYCNGDSFIEFSRVDSMLSETASFRNRIRSYIICVYVAHYACANGDTWASELGILSSSPPRLVTSLFTRIVPPGTNGGMSVMGTLASAAGGLFIGLCFYLMSFMFIGFDAPTPQWPIILIGLFSGFIGSLYDSILGATLQASYYDTKLKCIVNANTIDPKKKNSDVELICGINVLSNEQVNFISILMTMITIAITAPYFFDEKLLL